MIERAYRSGEPGGLGVWTTDQAGPFQTKPYPGASWQPEGQPARQPHEYLREATAKLMTLFHPASGRVRVKGVSGVTNAVLHPWLREHLLTILADLPTPSVTLTPEDNRALWESWQADLKVKPSLGTGELPPLRLLLVLDNLAGHQTPELVCWFFQHGIMPLYTPLGGSWLNMSESIQRILIRRALAGQHPETVEQIIDWLEATARGWNAHPTAFAWGGRRAARRSRARQRRHALPGSAAYTHRPIQRPRTMLDKWQYTNRMTH